MRRAIFISYRREDAEGQAGRLFDDLVRHFGRHSVFMDVAGIEPGQDFRRAIDDQVASCGVLLAVIGKSWLDVKDESGLRRLDDPTDFVRLETGAALKRDIPVVPVLVRGARMPRADQLPPDLADLAYRNAVELTHPRWDSDVQVLIRALGPQVELMHGDAGGAKAQPLATVPVAASPSGSTGARNSILVTGATGFLGYHVVKRLSEAGIRPRVLELRESRLEVLDWLDVERCPGHLEEPAAMRAACAGVDTVLHLAFKWTVGGGRRRLAEMQQVNVQGTLNLLQAAAASGVRRAVVTGSALSVGVSKLPVPLDESASWSQHAFDLPFATIRRQAELGALTRVTPRFDVVTVCPAFTFGPDDPTGAPANNLLQALMDRKLKFRLAIGFGCLDVRDFAHGIVLAAERGRSGQRYLLSGENVTMSQLLERVAAIAGVPAPRFTPPRLLVHGLVGALEVMCHLRQTPPPITRDVLRIIGRYAWYDTSKARAELGWVARPLQETLNDTIQWLRNPAAPGAGERVYGRYV